MSASFIIGNYKRKREGKIDVNKNILFFCYSRYVIFMAYLLRKQLGEENTYTLLISDTIEKENGIAEYLNELGIWQKVSLFHEKGRTSEEVKNAIAEYIQNNSIDVFFVSHIMRCSSHWFVKMLPNDTEVNLFDEGIISLDLLNGYKYWSRRGLPSGWPEFDFERINNFFVLYPSITKSVGKAKIRALDLDRLLKSNLEGIVNELNLMFNYTYEPIEEDIVIIDADIAVQGSVTQEYENYCVENMLRDLDIEKCIVKIKPSVSERLINEKYGKYNLKFMNNGVVPFEVIYLNCIIHNQLPKMFIAFPTTLLWNLILINQILQIASCKMISIANIMKDYYHVPGNAEDMMERIKQYQRCFGSEYMVELPETWSGYVECIRNVSLSNEEMLSIERSEKKWLLNMYHHNLNNSGTSDFFKKRSTVLYKWLRAVYEEKQFSSFFEQEGIDKIVIYGSGEFALLLYQELKNSNVQITDVIKTTVGEEEYFYTHRVIDLQAYMEKHYKKNVPVVLTAVGRENEQIRNLKQFNQNITYFSIESILNGQLF